jgi:hypothetical protein
MSRKKTAESSIFDEFMPSTAGLGDEDFYSDDEILISEEETKSRKPFQRFVLPVSVVLIATAFAAGITLTNSGDVEFGQGVLGLKACTSSLELAPVVGFVNEDQAKFLLEAVDISGIPESCVGFDFLIRVFDESNQKPLVITDMANDETIQVDYVRFSMLAGRNFTIIGQPNAYLEILDTTSALDSQIAVVYDAGANSGDIDDYADARDAYRVTVETFPTYTP